MLMIIHVIRLWKRVITLIKRRTLYFFITFSHKKTEPESTRLFRLKPFLLFLVDNYFIFSYEASLLLLKALQCDLYASNRFRNENLKNDFSKGTI